MSKEDMIKRLESLDIWPRNVGGVRYTPARVVPDTLIKEIIAALSQEPKSEPPKRRGRPKKTPDDFGKATE